MDPQPQPQDPTASAPEAAPAPSPGVPISVADYQVPDDKKPGDTVEFLAEARIEQDGTLTLTSVDGMAVSPPGGASDEDEDEAPDDGSSDPSDLSRDPNFIALITPKSPQSNA